MKLETKDVKSQSKVVGQATYKVYDSIAEAIDDVGDTAVLDLINRQTKTDGLNTVRSAAVGKPSKAALRDMALAEIPAEDFVNAAGDRVRLAALVEAKMTEIEQRLAAERLANAPRLTDEEEPEEEDED